MENLKSGGNAHAGNRTRVTSMGGLYDTITPLVRPAGAATVLACKHLVFKPFSARESLSAKKSEPKTKKTTE